MTDNQQANNMKRGPGRPWPKGVSGNLNGRPKKKGSIIEILEKMIEEQAPGSDQTIKELIARDMLLTVLDRRDKNHAEILKEILNRLYGKPKESIEVGGKDGGSVPVRIEYVPAHSREIDKKAD